MIWTAIFPRENREYQDLKIATNILEDLGYEKTNDNRTLEKAKTLLFTRYGKKYEYRTTKIYSSTTAIYMKKIKSSKELKKIIKMK